MLRVFFVSLVLYLINSLLDNMLTNTKIILANSIIFEIFESLNAKKGNVARKTIENRLVTRIVNTLGGTEKKVKCKS